MTRDGFYLGTHRPNWLADVEVPLFVSVRALRGRRTMPARPAGARWALDSGGFTELLLNGRWTVTPDQYVDEVARLADEVGGLDWAAPQDWIVAPDALAATGLTVRDHQARTVDNYLALAGRGPFVPALQGRTRAEYLDHVDQYAAAGIDLRNEALVALGSIAPRNADPEVVRLVRDLAASGIRLHGLGVKAAGLALYADGLASADSLAWSYAARNEPPLPGCAHRRCNGCRRYALRWRDRTLQPLAQAALF